MADLSISQNMNWPSPKSGERPYFDSFSSMVNAMDSSWYASREDRSIFISNGGLFSWSVDTGRLTWTETINIISPVAGFELNIPSGFISLAEGEYFYTTLIRSPLQDGTLTAEKSSQLPNTDDDYAIVIRMNNKIFFRNGAFLSDGSSHSGRAR